MGSLFQSAHMKLVQIIDRNDAARTVVAELGERSIFQFRDMNAGTSFFKRTFSHEVRRCNEVNRRLEYLHRELTLADLAVHERHEEGLRAPLVELDEIIGRYEAELKELGVQEMEIRRNHNALREQRIVLEVCSAIYEGALGAHEYTGGSAARDVEAPPAVGAGPSAGSPSRTTSPNILSSLVANEYLSRSDDTALQYVVGMIPRTRAAKFERVVFRVARGNCMIHNVPVDEDDLLDPDDRAGRATVLKNVVIVFFSGSVLRQKLVKICQYFGCVRYALPELPEERHTLLTTVVSDLGASAVLLDRSVQMRRANLDTVAHQWAEWCYTVQREKMTYNALNMCNFDARRKVFIAEGWIAVRDEEALKEALEVAARKAGDETSPILNNVSTGLTPPTYLPVGKVTAGFQALVDTYGVPKYREVNPGVFAVVLFPYLFGIMFGDIGHGALLVAFALWMICNEKRFGKRRLDDIAEMCFGGRYILLFNGLFAMYVGTLYNECFAVPVDFFGSRFVPGEAHGEGPYPWGIDPMWHHAENKITFFNSYKMKLSIVVGVAHMFLGILLSLVNHLENRSAISVFFQFLPEVVFFVSIFGYLVFMIMLKWAKEWPGGNGPPILNTLINMFMSPGTITEPPLFEGQATVQVALLAAAFLAVPLLLLPKPLIGYYQHRKASRAAAASNYRRMIRDSQQPPHEASPMQPAAQPAGPSQGPMGVAEEEEEYSFTDEFVHQVIHTIEFVLGSISNTASYLRLWALSLAHSQLSELFWEKVMVGFALSESSNVVVRRPRSAHALRNRA